MEHAEIASLLHEKFGGRMVAQMVTAVATSSRPVSLFPRQKPTFRRECDQDLTFRRQALGLSMTPKTRRMAR